MLLEHVFIGRVGGRSETHRSTLKETVIDYIEEEFEYISVKSTGSKPLVPHLTGWHARL